MKIRSVFAAALLAIAAFVGSAHAQSGMGNAPGSGYSPLSTGTNPGAAIWFKSIAYIDAFQSFHDGTTDDVPALNRAATALGSAGGYIQLTCGYNYRFGSNYTLPAGVVVRHCYPGVGNPGLDWATSPYANLGHVNLSATMTLSSMSGFVDALILNPACTFPAASLACYSGIAFNLTGGGANDVVMNTLMLGYKTCFDGTQGGSRQQLKIRCDANGAVATDAGIIIGPTGDRGFFSLQTYSFGTAAPNTVGALNLRTGIGIHQLSGISDGVIFEYLFDFGHDTGIKLEGNGNVEFRYIWTDNNATQNIVINGEDRSTFGTVYSYTGPGVLVSSNSSIHIDYLLCDTGVVSSLSCLTVNGASAKVFIDNFRITSATGFAVNLGSTTSLITLGSIDWSSVNGGIGPYVVGPANWLCNQVVIPENTRKTDLANGSSLYGGSVCLFPTVASATSLPLPVMYDQLQVTGTTTINTINGTWGTRRILLEFTGALTVNDASVSSGNISLSGGVSYKAVAGSTLVLLYDQTASLWREVSRSNTGVVIVGPDATSSNFALRVKNSALSDILQVRDDGVTIVNGLVPPVTNTYNLGSAGLIWANVIAQSHTATAAAPSASAGQINYGGTTVAAGASTGGGTCPTGTVGGASVAGCIIVNIAGTQRGVPFF